MRGQTSLEFDVLISACRQAYAEFQQLAGRTDEALYQALGQVYAIRFEMQQNETLQSRFDQLIEDQQIRVRPTKETLFLIKYAFFPHTLQAGPGHKGDITKGSRYAKLINKALAASTSPADFVAFAREHGIQRTAAKSLSRAHRYNGPPRDPRHWPGAAYLRGIASFAGAVLRPFEPWLYSAELATRIGNLLAEAQQQPQRLRLTVYIDRQRAVFTGCRGKPWTGEFPEGKIRVLTTKPTRGPAIADREVPSIRHPHASGLPLRRRGSLISRIAAR